MADADKKPTGTAQKFKDGRGRTYWRARASLPDGSRLWVGPRFTGQHAETRARELAQEKTQEAFDGKLTVADAVAAMTPAVEEAETCDQWHERYIEACEARGVSTVGDKGYRWGKWVSPKIGSKAPRDVTRDDVEDVRDLLDDAIRDGRLAWKTAANVWGEVTASFGEMLSSKRRDLRAIDVDPTHGVQPPERGARKSKVYPYPSEFLAVVTASDDKVPLAWKELHTIAAYTFARPGEMHVLEWSDVDLADGKISITKAWDYQNKRTKLTKTGESRTIPIEPNLLPLLVHMHERAGGEGLVVPLLSQLDHDKVALTTRKHFEAAGCVRPRLTARSSAERRLVFRSWRDAGITWSIVRGDDVVKVQRRAGHRLIATTMLYTVEAENRGAMFGVPFPPLPPSLLGGLPKHLPKRGAHSRQERAALGDSLSGRRDLNPRRPPWQEADGGSRDPRFRGFFARSASKPRSAWSLAEPRGATRWV
jgi:integrase